ncbi:MAG: hypothetical protein K2G36_04455 [Ruminococcus sp.]|nr:hypothetical protein [Ruminococcus sp.]
MKKLLAVLMACTMITGAFASCGDKEKDSSEVSEESSVSESVEDSSEAESSEEESEEESSEEESEEEEESSEEESEEEEESGEPEQPATMYQFLEDVDNSMFLGKWECEKIIVEGEEMTDFMGMPLYAVYQLNIHDDGTAVMGETLNDLSDNDVSMAYEWGIIGENEMVIINDDGTSMRFKVDGDYIVGSEDGYDEQIYFVKVDEFTPFDFEAFVSDFQSGLDNVDVELGDYNDPDEVEDESETDTDSDASTPEEEEVSDTDDSESTADADDTESADSSEAPEESSEE